MFYFMLFLTFSASPLAWDQAEMQREASVALPSGRSWQPRRHEIPWFSPTPRENLVEPSPESASHHDGTLWLPHDLEDPPSCTATRQLKRIPVLLRLPGTAYKTRPIRDGAWHICTGRLRPQSTSSLIQPAALPGSPRPNQPAATDELTGADRS